MEAGILSKRREADYPANNTSRQRSAMNASTSGGNSPRSNLARCGPTLVLTPSHVQVPP